MHACNHQVTLSGDCGNSAGVRIPNKGFGSRRLPPRPCITSIGGDSGAMDAALIPTINTFAKLSNADLCAVNAATNETPANCTRPVDVARTRYRLG